MSKLPKIRTRYLAPLDDNNPKKSNYPSIPETTTNSLNISNIKKRYTLNYGMEFKELLDARDQVMEHQFDFSFDVDDPCLLREE